MAKYRELDGFITDPCTGRHILEYDFPLNSHCMEFVVSVGGRPEQYSQRFRGETVYPIRLTRTSPTFFAETAYIGHKREGDALSPPGGSDFRKSPFEVAPGTRVATLRPISHF